MIPFIIVTLFGTVLYVIVAKQIIDYSGFEVCYDFLGNVLMASVMGIVVWKLGDILPFHFFIIMIIQVIVGAVTYFLLSVLTNASSFFEIKMMANKMFMKYKKG